MRKLAAYLINCSFLLESINGPLLSPHTGHQHIAFACESHLIQVLQLIDPELLHEKKTETVGLGCLGLQRYASQNWISHVLKFLAQAADEELNPEVPVIARLLQLTASHQALLLKVKPQMQTYDQSSASNLALEKLNGFPETRNLIRRVLAFQESFSARQLVEGPGMQLPSIIVTYLRMRTNLVIIVDILAVDSDTTLFSAADSSYQALVEFLLGSTASSCLTELELLAFKAQFGGTAFVCPVKGCARGFASAAELKDHKNHRHKQRLRCYEGKCVHNNVGFASTSSLQQHVTRVHRKDAPRIPTAIKRRKVEDHELAMPGLADLDVARLSSQYKKLGDGWHVIFNPALPRLLDVDLVHTLVDEMTPSCVGFSKGGTFVATGCDSSAQVYDVITGKRVSVLKQDHETSDDMYIRSVCFSPDGVCLATGGEDGIIRVSSEDLTIAVVSLLTQQGLEHRFLRYQQKAF